MRDIIVLTFFTDELVSYFISHLHPEVLEPVEKGVTSPDKHRNDRLFNELYSGLKKARGPHTKNFRIKSSDLGANKAQNARVAFF